MAIHRVVLLVSLGDAKVNELRKKKKLETSIRNMARTLRRRRGVRHIEAVAFRNWREGTRISNDRAPWKPHGALIFVEADTEDHLTRAIETIWGVASKFAQGLDPDEARGIEINSADSW